MNTLMRNITSSNKFLIIKKHKNIRSAIVNNLHMKHILYNNNESDNEIIPYSFNVKRKEKETFLEIIRIYEKEDSSRKAQLQFILTAIQYMDEFGVNKDLETYKALFNIFPKGKYVPENRFQNMFQHYPKHQNTAIQLFNKMEKNFVIPDSELQEIIMNIFGKKGLVMKKCLSLFYWLPRFSQLNPWPIPKPLPIDPKELAEFAIAKMSCVDVQANTIIYKTKDVPDAIDDTWIVSSMSRSQQELLAVQPINKSLTVEGPFMIWIDKYCIDYFVLKGDPIKREVIYEDYDDVSHLQIPFWEKYHFKIPVTIHEQEDGVYYAICATGTSSKDSLLSWIRCLQKVNPILEKIPITFKIKSFSNQQLYIENNKISNEKEISKDKNVIKK